MKQKSWEKIFDVFPPFKNEWKNQGKYIQATFWELRLDQVVAVRHFKGRKGNIESNKYTKRMCMPQTVKKIIRHKVVRRLNKKRRKQHEYR